jgi:hypothetical protein
MLTRASQSGASGGASHPHPLLDDCRLQLPSNNVFRYCSQNGMPEVPPDAREDLCLLTAAEIEAGRLARKRAQKSK